MILKAKEIKVGMKVRTDRLGIWHKITKIHYHNLSDGNKSLTLRFDGGRCYARENTKMVVQ